MRHRYIFCGLLDSRKISDYRLISKPTYSHGQLVRINIPDNLELSHYPGDGYSITNDERTIDELGYDCYILFEGKWRKFNWLKNIEPCWWFRALKYIFGLEDCFDTIGWTDNKDYYIKWRKEKRIPSLYGGGRKYPYLKEDKKGLQLKVNLQDDIDFFRGASGEDEWIVIYDKFKKELEENPDKEIWCK